MFCPKCKMQLANNSEFCPNCGINLKELQTINNNGTINDQMAIQNQSIQQPASNPQLTNNQQINDLASQSNINNNIDQADNLNVQVEQPINVQYPNLTMEQSGNSNIKQNKESKKSKIIILIIIAIVLLIIGIVLFLYFKNNDITSSSSFFIRNNDNENYALFNEEGEQLTEFIFSIQSYFVNGTAMVKKDDSYGIIDTNGKTKVEFGKYLSITPEAGLYIVRDKDSNKQLINGNGNVLFDLNDNELETFNTPYYSLLKENTTKTYKVLDYQGKVMVSFPIVGNAEGPAISSEDDYISVYYNKKNYVLNMKTGKEFISFNDSRRYCIKNVSEDETIFTLHSCVEWPQTQDKKYYKIIKNKKIYDLYDKCDDVYYEDGTLLCYKDYEDYFLDNNLNIGMNVSSVLYVDSNTYIKYNGNNIEFYNNGKVIKTVFSKKIDRYGYNKEGLYLLKNDYISSGYLNNDLEFYNTKGEKAFDKSFKTADDFDENHLAKVSDKYDVYYLIDNKGTKVSSDFDDIELQNNNYYIVKNNNLKGILDNNGNKIVDCKYSKIEFVEIQNKHYVKLTTTDSKYIVYDLDKKSEILTSDSAPNLKDQYISIYKNNNYQYYTYNGKLIYED